MGVTLQERRGTGIRLPSGTETAEATAILLGSRSGTDGSNPFPSRGEMLWGRRRGDGSINRCKEATDGVPYAPAERLEQVPRRPGPKYHDHCRRRDEPVELAGWRHPPRH